MPHPTLFVYAKMTDAEGTYDFLLELIHLDQAAKIAELGLKVHAPDRMAVGELILRLDNLVFPSSGFYEARLLADGRYLGSKTFSVVPSSVTGG